MKSSGVPGNIQRVAEESTGVGGAPVWGAGDGMVVLLSPEGNDATLHAGPGGEDALGKMLGGVGVRMGDACGSRQRREAERSVGGKLRAARSTGQQRTRATLDAEARRRRIL